MPKILPLCLTLLASPAFAQMPGMFAPPSMQGVWKPVVGSGAAYEMTDSNGKKMNLEVAVVGKEAVNGVDAYWIETSVPDPKTNQMMFMKMLMNRDKNNVASMRMIMQPPGQPQPIEMSMAMMTAAQGKAGAQSSDIREGAAKVGSEKITVPAGTFTCDHYKTKDGADVWVNTDIAPWGLVKLQGKETMVLTKKISGATDHITGTPMKLEDMMHGRH